MALSFCVWPNERRPLLDSIGLLFIVLVGADRAGQGTWRAVLWRSPLAIDGNPSTPSTPR